MLTCEAVDQMSKLLFFTGLILMFSCRHRHLFPKVYETNGKFGVAKGKDILLQPVYDRIRMGYDAYTMIADSSQTDLLFDLNGKRLNTLECEIIQEPESFIGYKCYYKDTGTGQTLCNLMNPSGKLIFKHKLKAIYLHSDGYFSLYAPNGICALASPQGNILTAFRYLNVFKWNDTLICIQNTQRKWGMITNAGKIAIPAQYDDVEFDSQNPEMVLLQTKGKYGYFDLNGKTIIPPVYKILGRYRNGLAFAEDENGKRGFINKHNQMILPFQAANNDPAEFNKGRCIIHLNDHYGTIDTAGKTTIPYLYDNLYPYNDSFYYSKLKSELGTGDSVFGFISREGKITSQYQAGSSTKEEPDSIQTASPVIQKFIAEHLHDLRYAQSYRERENYIEILISYGLLMNDNPTYYGLEGTFNRWMLYRAFAEPSSWQNFWQKNKIHYRHLYQSLSEYDKRLYLQIITHLNTYLCEYSQTKMLNYLNTDPQNFARRNPDGSRNPYRKIEAFFDRLILLHELITLKEAKELTGLILKDLRSW